MNTVFPSFSIWSRHARTYMISGLPELAKVGCLGDMFVILVAVGYRIRETSDEASLVQFVEFFAGDGRAVG